MEDHLTFPIASLSKYTLLKLEIEQNSRNLFDWIILII